MGSSTLSHASAQRDDDMEEVSQDAFDRTMIPTPEDSNLPVAAKKRRAPQKKSQLEPELVMEMLRRHDESMQSMKTMFEQVLGFCTNGQNVNNQDTTGSSGNQEKQRESSANVNSGSPGSPPPTENVSPQDDLNVQDRDSSAQARGSADNFDNLSPYSKQLLGLDQPNFQIINQITPPTFSGDRTQARSWLRQYEETMEINGYDDSQKLKRARAYLKGEASQWLTTRLLLNPNLDWYCLKSAFLRYFCGSDGLALLRKKLDEARQKPNESPSTYLVRIVDLCKEYKPHMRPDEIVQKIAHGLNISTYNNLASLKPQDDWSIQWMVTIFERFKSQAETRTREKDGDDRRKSAVPTTKKPRDLSTWICFNCSKTGHLIEDCPQPRDEERIRSMKEKHRLSKRKDSAQNGETPANVEQRKVNALNLPRDVFTPRLDTPVLACDTVPKPTLAVSLNGKVFSGRVDSGADITAIPGNVADELKLQILPWDLRELKAWNNSETEPRGMSTILVSLGNVKRALLVAILPNNMLEQPLWGIDLLHAFNLLPTYSASGIKDVNGNVTPAHDVDNRALNSVSADESQQHPVDKLKFGNVDDADKAVLTDLLITYGDVFSRDDNDIGHTTTVRHRIHLVDDKPIHRPPFRTPVRNREAMEETIKRLVATGAIRQSASPYASPIFFVDKDHGKAKRLVADYRALNSKTVPDRTPMPHPEDVFTMLAGSRTFAKLDITSMFNQIEVDERDVEKTAITTPFGLYECPLMPFGLVNAPATAVRLMKEVLRDFDGKTCFVYFDDIIVFAPDVSNLVQRCQDVLSSLRKHGLKLKPTKCVFAVDSVQFLGHVISAAGIEIDPRRIEQVRNFPIPRNPSDVKSFYGLCSYNRKFIRNFAEIAKPLTPLTGKPSDFRWTIEAQQSFETLREALTKAPILVHYNPDAEHELRTDASSYAIGAILYQRHERPEQTGAVLYYSKTMTSAQRNYSATERELLAAFCAITDLKHYLYGKKFTLVTDHAALSSVKNHKDPHHRLARWVAQLQCYDFDVVYKSGSKHLDADCMSRFISDEAPIDSAAIEHGKDIIRALCHVTTQNNSNSDNPDVAEPERENSIDMSAEQRLDSVCMKYITILESDLSESEKTRKAKNFRIINGSLHRTVGDASPTLVVPKNRQASILLSFHDAPLSGHLGFSRTYGAIKKRFYWPKMRKVIKQYVASCHNCQRRKAPNTRKQGFIRPLPIAEDVFDTVGFDLITKLPRTHAGYNTILVCTDNLSKYAIAVPLKNELAETIIHAFFNNLIAKHGCPKLVISDNGANLSGERSRDFFRLFGIKRHTTSPYHPQSNGQTERFNRTLAASLTIYVDKHQKDWSDFIQALTFAYNTTEHSVTHVVPFELVFGRKPRLPIENVLDRHEFVDPTRPTPGTLSSEATNLMKKYILNNQEANKRRLDARLAATSFKEGDLVLVERPTRVKGTASKLTYTYIGPYKIQRKINDLSFEISFLRGRPGTHVVHPCHLKKYIPRTSKVEDDLVDPTFVPRENVQDDDVIEDAAVENDAQNVNDFAQDEDEIESPPFEPITPPESRDN